MYAAPYTSMPHQGTFAPHRVLAYCPAIRPGLRQRWPFWVSKSVSLADGAMYDPLSLCELIFFFLIKLILCAVVSS